MKLKSRLNPLPKATGKPIVAKIFIKYMLHAFFTHYIIALVEDDNQWWVNFQFFSYY